MIFMILHNIRQPLHKQTGKQTRKQGRRIIQYRLVCSIMFLISTGAFSFFSPRPAAASLSMSVRELGRNFFSGEEIERTILIEGFWSKDAEVVICWQTLVRPAIIERGREEIKLKSGRENRIKIRLKMPEVKRRTELAWKLHVVTKGRRNSKQEKKSLGQENERLRQEFHYSVFPQDIPQNIKNILSGKIVGFIDTKGSINEIFEYLDLPFTSLKSRLSLKTFQGDLIIIGPETLSPGHLYHALPILEEKVSAGLTVLCFAHKDPPQFMTVLEIVNRTAPPRPEFLLSPKISAWGHPVFQEIKEGDLSNWRGEGTRKGFSAGYPYVLPKGNFRALVRADSSEQTASSLIEVPHGLGKFIFCQLPVVEKFKEEPAARLLLENLIRYAFMKQERLRPAAIYGGPESEMMELLDSLRVAGPRRPHQLDDFYLAIICADRELAQLKERRFQVRLKQFVHRGGTLIVFGLVRENLNFLKEIIPGFEGEISPTPPFIKGGISFNRGNPLLWGITEEDVKEIEIFCVENFLNLKGSKRVKMLIKPGALVKIEQGQGQIILCQIRFKEDEETSLRFLSQLLTNLGIEITAEKEVN